MDNEALTLQEGDEVQRYIASQGWKKVKEKFTEKIMDLQSIKNLEGTSPEEIVLEIKARNTTVDILMDIIKDLEGRAEQHQNNSQTNPEIIYYEDLYDRSDTNN